MNFRKLISSTICVAMCVISLLPARNSLASANGGGVSTRNISEPFSIPIIDELGTISTKTKLVLEKKEYRLYCTFDNPVVAIKRLYDSAPSILGELEKRFGFKQLTVDNWAQYRDAMYEFVDSANCPEWLHEGNTEYQKMNAFFDIIENDSVNHGILELANRFGKNNGADVKRILFEELLVELPYHEVAEELDMTLCKGSNIAGYAGFNETQGIEYANRHATNRNKAQYHSFNNADCANFTSQILENGGIQQVVYTDVHKGWWHIRKIGLLGIVTHSHSRSWAVADVFARYMGVSYTTTSNLYFSFSILPGDFVAGDWTSDGNWDHMGFITGKRIINNKTSYDYKVAQHTTDYNKWWTENGNNWEDVGRNGGTYARIRRAG